MMTSQNTSLMECNPWKTWSESQFPLRHVARTNYYARTGQTELEICVCVVFAILAKCILYIAFKENQLIFKTGMPKTVSRSLICVNQSLLFVQDSPNIRQPITYIYYNVWKLLLNEFLGRRRFNQDWPRSRLGISCDYIGLERTKSLLGVSSSSIYIVEERLWDVVGIDISRLDHLRRYLNGQIINIAQVDPDSNPRDLIQKSFSHSKLLQERFVKRHPGHQDRRSNLQNTLKCVPFQGNIPRRPHSKDSARNLNEGRHGTT